MQLTISGKDKRNLNLIRELAEKLGLKVKGDTHQPHLEEKVEDSPPNSEAIIKLMEEMQREGSFSSIDDPVAWQREIRKDKPLYDREE